MNALLFLCILLAIALLSTGIQAWLDRRLIQRTLRQQGGRVLSIKRQWMSEVPVASRSRTYHVLYRTETGDMQNRSCQVFGIILWRELVWLNPLADFRLMPKQRRNYQDPP